MATFAKKVLLLGRKIPKGKVCSYGSLASAAGNPKAARAVGRIMSQNDYSQTKLPCHRVISSDGSLGGYNGGIAKKIRLLRQEGIDITDGKIDLSRFNHIW